MLPGRGFLYLRVGLGLVLLVTAGLKAHGLTIDPLAQNSFLGSPRLLVATIEIEIILGLWLLSGWWARAGWMATLGFFAILAGVSFYLARVGQASCGCFGTVAVSPWLTAGLDVALLAALLLWRPTSALEIPTVPWIRALIKVGAGTVVFLVLIVGTFLFAIENPVDAVARLRGESITVEPPVADLGEGYPGETTNFRIELTNRTTKAVRIIGGTSHCSCVATVDLPVTISPGETWAIQVGVKFEGSSGKFQHAYLLYTDDEWQQIIIARFAGRVRDRPD